jgi:ribonuclease R
MNRPSRRGQRPKNSKKTQSPQQRSQGGQQQRSGQAERAQAPQRGSNQGNQASNQPRSQQRGSHQQRASNQQRSSSSQRGPQSARTGQQQSPQSFQRPQPSITGGALVDGRVDIHADGFGFLIPDKPEFPNCYIHEDQLKNVMHRDRVRVRMEPSPRGDQRARGVVVSIIGRHQKEVLGTLRTFKGGALVVPLDPRDRHHGFKVVNQKAGLGDIKGGTTVLARILSYPEKIAGTVEISDLVKDPNSASNDTLKVIVGASWPREFSKAALGEADAAARSWKENLGHTRRDIRHLDLVTIDGRDARDFDDAVCASVEGSNIRLWVAIADVSLFVKPNTVLEREAWERATSVYFPDFVVPMLPEVLSNGVCSLNPFEERACLVAEMLIDGQGRIKHAELYEGLMQSKRRLTYEQMQAFIDGELWAKAELEPLHDSLNSLKEVFHRLLSARERRGAMDLDLPEAQILLNADGTVRDILARTRVDAHRLIEECMLAANECAAAYIGKHFSEGMYRVHELPDPKKIKILLEYLEIAGLGFFQKKSNKKMHMTAPEEALQSSKDFANLIESLKSDLEADDPKLKAVQFLILRTMKQARYSPQRLGHFALGLKDYTHFTSPIRRLPDLIVHRLIKEALKVGPQAGLIGMDLESLSRHCSDQERAAMDAERKVIEIKKCRFLEPRLGEEFMAWVSGITEKGAFCQVDGHFVDGLISAESLSRYGRFQFNPQTLTYVGPKRKNLELGTRVKVLLAAVSVETRRVDFELLEMQ